MSITAYISYHHLPNQQQQCANVAKTDIPISTQRLARLMQVSLLRTEVAYRATATPACTVQTLIDMRLGRRVSRPTVCRIPLVFVKSAATIHPPNRAPTRPVLPFTTRPLFTTPRDIRLCLGSFPWLNLFLGAFHVWLWRTSQALKWCANLLKKKRRIDWYYDDVFDGFIVVTIRNNALRMRLRWYRD